MHLSSILSVWADEPEEVRDQLKSLRRTLYAPLAHQLGWEFAPNEDYLTNILRVLVLTNAGRSNDPATVAEAKKRFWAFVDGDSEALHPNLRGPIYGIVLLTAEDEEEEKKLWERVLAIYRDEKLPYDQRLIALNALGTAKSPALVQRYLEMSVDEQEIRGQDSIYVFRA